MTDKELTYLKIRFEQYVERFIGDDGKLHPLLQLKLEHSEHVAVEARALSQELEWSPAMQNTAEGLGLVHDIGRFPQFRDFKTFSDASVSNHAEMGSKALKSEGILADVNAEDQEKIFTGTYYHNCLEMPKNLSSENLLFLQLIRDADKLDIYRVVLENLNRDGFIDLLEMRPGISLDPKPSPEFTQEICRNQKGSMANIQSLGDFLLMQMSWVYDLNFRKTIEHVLARGILTRLEKHVAITPESEPLTTKIKRDARDTVSNGTAFALLF